MSMRLSLRRTLHWGGSGLAVTGIIFVLFHLHSYWKNINLSKIEPLSWCLIAGMVIIYGAANSILALAWWHLLGQLKARIARLDAIRIYGITQLARYLPGNIFHLAGRQALGMAAGISGVVLVKSSIWELGLIAFAGSLFGWLILPLVETGFQVLASIVLLVGSGVFVAAILARFVGRQAMWAFVCQMFFLILSESVFVVLLYVIADNADLNIGRCIVIGGAYTIAWLVGLVTPGAPAGVGVRELVLLSLLQGFVSEADLLMTTLLSRLVTVIGDILFFLATSSILVANTNSETLVDNTSVK